MQWFALQRLIEMSLGLILYKKFAACKSLAHVLDCIVALNQFEQVGCITMVVIIIGSVGQTIKTMVKWVMKNRR